MLIDKIADYLIECDGIDSWKVNNQFTYYQQIAQGILELIENYNTKKLKKVYEVVELDHVMHTAMTHDQAEKYIDQKVESRANQVSFSKTCKERGDFEQLKQSFRNDFTIIEKEVD